MIPVVQSFQVDPNMVQDLEDWILSRAQPDGGFEQSTEHVDTFGKAPVDVNNVYILWALTSSGITNSTIYSQISYAVTLADDMIDGNKPLDTYMLGLIAASLYNVNKNLNKAD